MLVAPFVVPLPSWFPTKPTADTSIVTHACGIILHPPPRRLIVTFVGLASPRVDQLQLQQYQTSNEWNSTKNSWLAGWLVVEGRKATQSQQGASTS
jgi:hypothetical protein